MNPNQQQALQDEQAGMEEEGEDIDLDAVYGGEDVDVDSTPSPELQNDYKKIFGDVTKQFTKETLIGLGGSYGDLAELAGIPQAQPQSANSQNSVEFDALERMEQPGYEPSLQDIELMSDDMTLPRATGLPNSEGLRSLSDALGGPGEAETPQGKYAGRSGRLYGSGLAFGQVNPLPAVAGGIAGQATEDLGGGPLAQAAAEIATLILSQGKSGVPLQSTKDEIKTLINEMRQLGYNDEQITLAVNAANKGGKRAKIASKGKSTENAFEDFATKSDDLVSDILTSEIPGIESGTQEVHRLASEAYGHVAQEGSKLVIKDSTPFINSATNVVRELRKNLGRNPEAEGFLGRLAEAVVDSTRSPTAENFMNFYKELNSMGNWLGRSQKDRLISQVKDGIKETFRSEGKAGRQLATQFEEANSGIRKAYQAEEVHDLLMKSATQDGIDYKKMNKLFDKAENVQLFEQVLGPQQTRNLNLISKTGKEVKDFDKSWKAANSFRPNVNADVARGGLGLYYLLQGDWQKLGMVAATKGGSAAVRKLAEKSLTSPALQNLMIKGLHAVKNASPSGMKAVDSAMKKYMEDEGIDIDLD